MSNETHDVIVFERRTRGASKAVGGLRPVADPEGERAFELLQEAVELFIAVGECAVEDEQTDPSIVPADQ
jgi:hypothetical protein